MPESFNHFNQIATRLDTALSRTVRKVAFDIQKDAQNLAPVDTGFLKNSIYVSTDVSSTYGNAGSPPGDAYLLPEEVSTDKHTAYVGVGANYGEYIEFGTVHMPAQPFFYQAVDWGLADLEDVLSRIEEQLGTGAIFNDSEREY